MFNFMNCKRHTSKDGSYRQAMNIPRGFLNILQSNIFCGLRYLQRFLAKDIQSRCRNLREMKDVFRELKVWGRKRKS